MSEFEDGFYCPRCDNTFWIRYDWSTKEIKCPCCKDKIS